MSRRLLTQWLDLLWSLPNGQRLLIGLLEGAQRGLPKSNLATRNDLVRWTKEIVPGDESPEAKLESFLIDGRLGGLWKYNSRESMSITVEGTRALEALQKNLAYDLMLQSRRRAIEQAVYSFLATLPPESYTEHRSFICESQFRQVGELNAVPMEIRDRVFNMVPMEVRAVSNASGQLHRATPRTRAVEVFLCPSCEAPMTIYDHPNGPVICSCSRHRISHGGVFCDAECPDSPVPPAFVPGLKCSGIFCHNLGRVYPANRASLQQVGAQSLSLDIQTARMVHPVFYHHYIMPGRLEVVVQSLLEQSDWLVGPLNPGGDVCDVIAQVPDTRTVLAMDTKLLHEPNRHRLRSQMKKLADREDDLNQLAGEIFDGVEIVVPLVVTSQIRERLREGPVILIHVAEILAVIAKPWTRLPFLGGGDAA